MFELTVVKPHERLITVSSTDPLFKRTQLANYVESRRLYSDVGTPDWVVADQCMVFLVGGREFVSRPVSSALLEGSNWKYEAI